MTADCADRDGLVEPCTSSKNSRVYSVLEPERDRFMVVKAVPAFPVDRLARDHVVE